MAKLQLTDLEIYVKDLKAARAFYTKKIGLKVRSSMPKIRRKGVSALTFVTVVSKDSKKTGEFFKKALGMKSHRVPGEEGFTDYRFSEKETSIMPFTPTKEMYDNPTDFDSDVAHIGEETGIGFTTDDIYKLQEQLLAKGVRFKEKAEAQGWGGIMARFFDLDDNVYSLVQYED